MHARAVFRFISLVRKEVIVAKKKPSKYVYIQTAIRILREIAKSPSGLQQLKFWAKAMAELSLAREKFSKLKQDGNRLVSIFGSARTPPDHPAYLQSVAAGRKFAENSWKVLTGAGGGIMEGGHVGAGKENSAGINIELPCEQEANPVVIDSPWLVAFKYFFGRKITFVEKSDGIVALPGGFGSLDESFEVLTLMQTGKCDLRPFVFLDAPGGTFWKSLEEWMKTNLFNEGYVSKEDKYFYIITSSVEVAYSHIANFYNRYRGIYHDKGLTYVRMTKLLTEKQLARLNREFGDMLVSGKLEQVQQVNRDPENNSLSHLPRLVFRFKRNRMGTMRHMINVINSF